MKKTIALICVLVLAATMLAACSSTPVDKPAPGKEGFTFTVSIDRNEQGLIIDQTVTEVPSRVICSGFQMAGMLVDLGLEDRIVGVLTSRPESWNTSYAPGVSEKLGKLKILGKTDSYSKEMMLADGCDFLMGWDSTFSDKRYDVEFCQANNIIMYPPYCTYDAANSMEDIYKDYETLGKIFHVEEAAAEKIAAMKEVMAEVEKAMEGVSKPITILNYDSGTDDVFTACQGMPGAIFKYAGGISIFDDINKGWARVSWEEIVNRNPEYIIINNYSGSEEEAQASKDFLLSVDALANVDAVKNGRIFAVNLDDMEGSAGTAYLIREIAKTLYPDRF